MLIQVRTGPNIEANEARVAMISGVVEGALGQFSDSITRVEAHLSDENSDKKTGHKAIRCMLEARVEGHRPLAVTNNASILEEAVVGAAEKLNRLIENTLGRQREQQSRRTDPAPSPPEPELEGES